MSRSSKPKPTETRPAQGGAPNPAHATAAEQARELCESESARNAEASIRERMVDIGRGNLQAGRQEG